MLRTWKSIEIVFISGCLWLGGCGVGAVWSGIQKVNAKSYRVSFGDGKIF